MTVRRKVKVYFEKNRSGKLKKIHAYKDKDDEDTTLTFWVKLPDNSMQKIGEFIFTEDMELEDEDDDDEEPIPEPTEPKAPVIDLDENQNIAGNVNEDVTMSAKVTDANGNDTIEEVIWKQTLGPAQVVLNISEDRRTATFKTAIEGDYLFTVNAKDNTGLSAIPANVNVKIRAVVDPDPEPTDQFENILAAFGDCNSTAEAATIFKTIGLLNVPVLALGDYEYDTDFNDFKSKLGSLLARIATKCKGNHDDNESEPSSIETANNDFWKWGSPAVNKAVVGNVGIVAMDTQDGNITEKTGTQYKFVEAALKEFAALDWRIVTVHKPLRCPKTKHSEEVDVREVYEPLFKKYGVALVGQGHNHNQWISKLLNGTTYFGNGNSGNDLYQIDSNRDYIAWSDDNNFGYVVIQQKKDKTQLKIKFFSMANKVLHEAVINRFDVIPTPEPPVCKEGEHWDDIQGRCVPNPEPEPEPTGEFLWQSKTAWNNGLEKNSEGVVIGRHLTGHHQFDKYDKTFEVAAGENRDWFINGKGRMFSTGPRTRGYQHTKQKAGQWYEWITFYKPNSSLENWSGEFFSRHNEEGEGVNRYGGPTFAFYLDKITFQEEYWHNERDGSLNASKNLSVKGSNGQTRKIKVLGRKIVEGSAVRFEFKIYINDKLEWEHDFKTNHDEAAIKEALYYRWRVNGSSPKNVENWDWSIREVAEV